MGKIRDGSRLAGTRLPIIGGEVETAITPTTKNSLENNASIIFSGSMVTKRNLTTRQDVTSQSSGVYRGI